MPDIQTILATISVWGIPILLAITLHEAGHAYMAKLKGDTTAYMLGRVSLNPLKHIDPFGTILLPLLLATFSPFIIGYAKPVPVNFGRLNNPRIDTIWVALAGPFANLILAFISIGFIYLTLFFPSNNWSEYFIQVAIASLKINVLLMVFNLIPLLPLDGGRVLESLLPHHLAYKFSATEKYGMLILLMLLFSGILFQVIGPIISFIMGLLIAILPI